MVFTKRGQLIVVEGLDRAGKSTQVERLVKNLTNDGLNVEQMRFPGVLSEKLLWYDLSR